VCHAALYPATYEVRALYDLPDSPHTEVVYPPCLYAATGSFYRTGVRMTGAQRAMAAGASEPGATRCPDSWAAAQHRPWLPFCPALQPLCDELSVMQIAAAPAPCASWLATVHPGRNRLPVVLSVTRSTIASASSADIVAILHLPGRPAGPEMLVEHRARPVNPVRRSSIARRQSACWPPACSTRQ
jgi:hypothetical protein